MNILALDLGTKTGFCYGTHVYGLTAGTWTLALPKEVTAWRAARQDRTCDPRMGRLREKLLHHTLVDMVVFEDVEFSSYTKQTQLWSSFRTVVWLNYFKTARFECVPVSTLKKFATGHGNATKPMMAAALRKQEETLKGLDDNAVDAVWLWLWARQNLSRIRA